MKRVTWMRLACLGLALAVGGCGDDDEPATNRDGSVRRDAGAPADSSAVNDAVVGDGAELVSLQSDVVPIMSGLCGACHKRGGNPAAIADGVYFETKDDILAAKTAGFIIADDAAGSGLIKILSQDPTSPIAPAVMPPPSSGFSKMSDADLAVISTWVNQGALDN